MEHPFIQSLRGLSFEERGKLCTKLSQGKGVKGCKGGKKKKRVSGPGLDVGEEGPIDWGPLQEITKE